MPVSYRLDYERRERHLLSPLATLSSASKGRLKEEASDSVRTCFQRDRDRVLHCKSFRRLAYKTQVFLSPAGDHYRTRITHTLEVAQIARTIARGLRLNEDLTEAIALAHDLGHTPFGHSGEAVLNRQLPGGFHHVQQSLRVVDILEREGSGLNLTHEVRDGILKHSKGKGSILAGDGAGAAATLEGQVVRVADIIAYLNHDLDDALRAKVLKVGQIPQEIIAVLGETHSARITFMVLDVLKSTELEQEPRVRLSQTGNDALTALRAFMYDQVYENPEVREDMAKAERLLQELWTYFLEEEPGLFRERHWPLGVSPHESPARAVADYIASMTDRFAIRMHERCLLPKTWSVF